MANVVNVKLLVACDEYRPQWVEVEWDFAKDGGAIGDLGLMSLSGAHRILRAEMHIMTTCVGASGTLEVGKTADTAGIIAQTAVASLVAGVTIYGPAVDASNNMADASVVNMTIATTAFTAGKIRFLFEVQKLLIAA